MQLSKAADSSRTQFGWDPKMQSFLVGEREIQANGMVYAPPSAATLHLLPMYTPKGSLDAWRSVMQIYSGPDQVDRAFAVCLGLGNIFLPLTQLKGYVLSLYSPTSGTGKTTILQSIASIYGHPDDSHLLIKDTPASRWQRLGALCNLPALMDEITDMKPEDKGSLAFEITQGRARNRQRADINAERVNKTFWQTGLITTANKSLAADLLSNKAFPAGELARVIDVHIQKPTTLSPAQSRAHFSQLYSHHGTAIVPVAQYALQNMPAVEKLLQQITERLEHDLQAQSMERFWVVMGALAMLGNIIGNKVGIWDIPSTPLYRYTLNLLRDTRARFDGVVDDSKDFFHEFLRANAMNTLVVNAKQNPRMGALSVQVIREPKGQLVVRYEADTKQLYIAKSVFRAYCATRSMDPDMAIADQVDCGSYGGLLKKRLSANSSLGDVVNVLSMHFDTRRMRDFDHVGMLAGVKIEENTDPYDFYADET